MLLHHVLLDRTVDIVTLQTVQGNFVKRTVGVNTSLSETERFFTVLSQSLEVVGYRHQR